MFFVKISQRRPVAVMMLVLLLIICGTISYFKIPVELIPESEVPIISIQISYPGAGPEEIETSVLKPVEEQLTVISNVKNITSFSAAGAGLISVECSSDADPDIEALNIKGKIDQILSELPDVIQKTAVCKVVVNKPHVLKLALYGPLSSEQLRTIAKKQVLPQVMKIAGVADVSIIGGTEREIQINVYKHRLDALNLSFQDIATTITAQTANISSGTISGNFKEFSVNVKGELESIEQIRNIGIPVFSRKGTVSVPLYTIAEIKESQKETREIARFNGQNSIGISIGKEDNSDLISVSDSVRLLVSQINRMLPSGTAIVTVLDLAESIRNSVKNMLYNILPGTVLVALMLLILLGSWGAAIITVLIIPVSILISCVAIQLLGLSLNPVSLIAITIGICVIVVNAIIVMESIIKKIDAKSSTEEAIVHGTSEVTMIIMTILLFSLAVFLPIVSMKGISVHFFKNAGLIIVIFSFVSLLLSFFVVPLLVSKLLVYKRSFVAGFRLLNILPDIYLKILHLAIRLKYGFMFLVFIMLIGTVLFLLPRTGMELFPAEDCDIIDISMKMAPGTTVHQTDRTIRIIEDKLKYIPEIKTLFSTLGNSGVSTEMDSANVTVLLKNKKHRSKTAKNISNLIRSMLVDIPDAEIVVKVQNPIGEGRAESDIVIEISGDENSALLQIADTVVKRVRTISDLTDIQCSSHFFKPELILIPDRFAVNKYAAKVKDIGLMVRDGLSGKNIGVYREGDMEFPVRIQYSESDRNALDALENYSISTANGNVSLNLLCNVKFSERVPYICRKNGKRLISITANTVNGASVSKKRQIKVLTDSIKLPAGYAINYAGLQGKINECFRAAIIVLGLVVVLSWMVLAGATESILMSLMMIICLTSGFAGAFWMFYFSGQSISMISPMFAIILIFVTGSHAVIIIDKTRSLQKSGLNPGESFVEACKTSLKTIVMISLSVILFMAPLVVNGSAAGKQFAVTGIGGIVVSTIVILFVIPALYGTANDKKH